MRGERKKKEGPKPKKVVKDFFVCCPQEQDQRQGNIGGKQRKNKAARSRNTMLNAPITVNTR